MKIQIRISIHLYAEPTGETDANFDHKYDVTEQRVHGAKESLEAVLLDFYQQRLPDIDISMNL